MKTEISSKLFIALKKRIDERRQTVLVSLMIYLQNPQNFILKKNRFFSLSPKPEIIKLAGNVLLRLHPHDYIEEEVDDDDVRIEVSHENIKIKQRKALEES